MKKFLISLLIVGGLFAVRQASAVDVSNGRPPSIGAYGGTLNKNSMIQLGDYPGAQAYLGIPMTALVNVTQGDALVLVAGKGVSKTGTVGDERFIGFATETITYNNPVQVAMYGIFRARVGTSTTVGDRFTMSANAGFLTPSSAVTSTLYTPVSGTPVVARALETKAYVSTTASVLVIIGNR
jgi:hypothetical protein